MFLRELALCVVTAMQRKSSQASPCVISKVYCGIEPNIDLLRSNIPLVWRDIFPLAAGMEVMKCLLFLMFHVLDSVRRMALRLAPSHLI